MSSTIGQNKITRSLLYILLLVAVIIWMIPFAAAVITSLRSNDEIISQGFLSMPSQLRLDSFKAAWTRGNLRQYLPNSFIVTIPSLLMTLFFSSLAAFALSKYIFRGRAVILGVFVGGMMLPFQILLLPVFKLSESLGMYDTYWALIGIHTAFQLGFCTFVLRNYMVTIPDSVSEAARIDGCNDVTIYSKIIMPLVIPAMAAIATLEFTWIFNDYIWALILLRTERLMPVTAGLAKLQGQYVMDWTVITAGALLAAVPTIFIFLFLQKYFIKGLTMGSNK